MPDFRVDSIYDIASLQAEQDRFLSFLADSKAAIVDLNNQRVTIKSADISTFTQASEQMNKTINQSTTATTNAATATKQLTLAQAQARQATLEHNAALKSQVISNNAAAGSYIQMEQNLKQLVLQYKNLSVADRNSATGQGLQKQILETNTNLKTLDAGIGNYQRNVGNYSSAFQNYALTLRGLRGPTKLLGEALGIGAQEADQFRLVVEHSFQAISAFFRSKESKAAEAAENALKTQAETAAQEANTVATEQATVAETQLAAVRADNIKESTTALVEENALTEAKAESVVATTAQLTTEEQLEAVRINVLSQVDAQIASEIALSDAKYTESAANVENTASLGENIVLTEAATVAETELAVATTSASTAMSIFLNILKFSGIALVITSIVYFAFQIAQLGKAFFAASETAKLLRDIEKDASKTFGESSAKIDILKTKLNDLTISQKDRIQYAKEYNEVAEKTNKIDTDQVDNLTQVNSQITKQIQLLRDRAIAQAASNVLSQKAEALFKAQIEAQAAQEENPDFSDAKLNGLLSQAQQRIDQARQKLGTAKISAAEALSVVDLSPDQLKDAIAQQDRFKVLQDQSLVTFLQGIQKRKLVIDQARQGLQSGAGFIIGTQKKVAEAQVDFDKTLATVSSLINPDSFKTEKDPREKHLQDQSALLREYLKKDQEQISLYAEQNLKTELEKYKSEYENQDNSENDRLASLQAYHDKETELIKLQAKAREDALNVQQTTDLAKAAEIKNAKLKAATIAIITKEGKDELLNINSDADRQQQANDLQFSKDSIKIVDEGFKKEEKLAEDHTKTMRDIQQKRLDDAINNAQQNVDTVGTGLINDAQENQDKNSASVRAKNEEDLQRKLTQLEKEGELDRLQVQDQDLDEQRNLLLLYGEDTSDIDAKITANKKKEAEIRKGIVDDEINYEIKKRDELLDNVLIAETQLLEITQAIGDGKYQRQKDDAQKESDLIDAQTQKKIDAVNAEVLSDQDKAAKITIINARAAAEKQALDLKQRKADHDKAVFDKEIAILQIIAQIAIDIAEAKYGAAALAGAALIKLIATPIPAYKHGRGEGKDELAIVGDGGVNEYIMRGTGTIEKTPAVNTLTHLMPTDKVYKNKEALMKELMLNNMQLSDYSVSRDGGINKNDIERMTNRIEQAVNNIKVPPSTQITKEGWRMVNEKNLKYDQWVNRTIKN